MERSDFIKTILFAPAFTPGIAGNYLQKAQEGGVRRLSRERNFTTWRPVMDPAYRVTIGEVVLVDMSHGMPGLVTRDGVFREPGPDAIINPQTGPIFVEGIATG